MPARSFLLRLMDEFGNGGHSIFAPSGSAMWLYCSGSLIANLLEDDEGSYEAAEGTVAHELGEQWLKSGVKPVHRLGEIVSVTEGEGKPVYEVPIDEVMLDFVEEYVLWCEWLEGDHFVEQRVYFTELMPYANQDEIEEDPLAVPVDFVPQGGTADHVCCMMGLMIITDFKYGKGIWVDAVGNTQAMLYALGFFYKWDWKYHFEKIVIRIAQPRLHNWGEWEITRDELLDFAEFVRERAAKAWQINAPRRVSAKGCQWCKAKDSCVANAVALENLVYRDFDLLAEELTEHHMSMMKEKLREEYKMHLAKVAVLDEADMVRILEFRRPVEQWFKAINAKLEAAANAGHTIPGKKLVDGKSNRVFRNQKAAIDHLLFLGLEMEDIVTEEVISPAQAEEKLRKVAKLDRKSIDVALRNYVFKPPGKPTLVNDDDPRVALGDHDDGAWDDE